ncbi:carboxymethylenebutenolidase [Hypericibacter terrae]|jgi:carboxymethylenebutenolidase|uniref:Carboxymethylenebutenolidase n=1 Tax=Hypericibacter terrae TaxID=2602015 RepID=A0A5J6MJZ7_9PROT|nr:dienelactone hydrolase family protein [Hypericibacter terrae]QEX17587.1 carboxymethylenebutenolidase [Hypericibacter terrae]
MGSQVELKAADGFKLAGYRAEPAGASKGGLVVIQEIFGVNHHIRSVTDRFAAQGYTALAPALFDRTERGIDIGYDEAAMNRGVKLRAAIKLEDTLLDVAAAIQALKGAGKIAVVGYCWGGSLAFLSATRLSGLACTVGYYGGMIAAHAKEKPKVPVMLHFGEHDHGIPMSDVEKIKAARPEVKIFTYDAGHGFSCDERASFDKASHEKALGRTLAFFKEHLGA